MPSARPGSVAALLAAAASLAAGGPPAGPRPAPVHADAAQLERAMLDADRALLYGDGPAAREAFDRVERSCRRVGRDERPAWPGPMVDQDAGMHVALDRAREFAARGEIEDTIGTMAWIMRCCRTCHALRDGRSGSSPPPREGPAGEP